MHVFGAVDDVEEAEFDGVGHGDAEVGYYSWPLCFLQEWITRWRIRRQLREPLHGMAKLTAAN